MDTECTHKNIWIVKIQLQSFWKDPHAHAHTLFVNMLVLIVKAVKSSPCFFLDKEYLIVFHVKSTEENYQELGSCFLPASSLYHMP